MQYLIDGHNLIGQLRTVNLADPDDEAKLVALLHRWVLRHNRHRVTVVFDGGVYGHPHALDRPSVRTVFAHSPQDADARLLALVRAHADPRHVRVVTADRALALAVRAAQVDVIDARTFAAELEQPTPVARSRRSRRQQIEPKLSTAEVDQWLHEFGVDDGSDQASG